MQRLYAGLIVLFAMATGSVPSAWAMSPEGGVQPAWVDASPHRQGFVVANGVRLQYLDWGGEGAALILISGLGENPHVFDDLAPAFADRYHVIAYARRGHDLSEAQAPYDTATLTEDLRALMDALQIGKANLVGWSLGGNEISTMAAKYPTRVLSLIYLDAAYDWSDPELKIAFDAFPAILREVPASAMASMDNYRAYERAGDFSELPDMNRVEAYLRENVIVQRDGSLKRRMPKEVEEALYTSLWTNPRLDYTRVRCPVLAIYAPSAVNLSDPNPSRRRAARAWEESFMTPFRVKSIARVGREISNVQVITVPGRHNSFFLTSRQRVVDAMRRFLIRKGDNSGCQTLRCACGHCETVSR
jgi:pimeloyl-ACP methyl ester carboxylesterase